ncbi:MAG: hypothetical protein JWM44_4014 [Bacilli bacterium]|nr:hypothetical protein [Bacilli bacterium]
MGSQYLSNEELLVELAEIGDYQGSRFDWSGFITQVRLKAGNHTFCVFEKETSPFLTGGAGICNEFGLMEAIGFEEIGMGDYFPKLGVGLLKREDELKYAFYKAYPISPFSIEVTNNGQQSVQYVVQPKECNGYAAKLVKQLSIQGASLRIDYSLHNIGSKVIDTNEYTHNFIGIDGHSVGPDYCLKFSFPLELELMEKVYTPTILLLSGNEVKWSKKPNHEFYCRLKGFPENQQVQWELTHTPSGVGVRETSSFPASMIAVWGASHVVSPEVFIHIHLNPGEVQSWTRTYDFFSS